MFAKNIIGTANGLVAGWGRVGGCFIQRFMGNILLPAFVELFRSKNSDNPYEQSWRTVSTIPAAVAILSGIIIYFITDDTPKGNYAELKRHNGTMNRIPILSYVYQAIAQWKTLVATWVLFIEFACCYGVDLTMSSAAALYFAENFGIGFEAAAALAGDLCYMPLLGPLLGGIISDLANVKFGMRGRILSQVTLLLITGVLVLAFPATKTLGSARAVFILVLLFSQAAQGSTFAIVPYVCLPATGWVMGIVGAGGNLGVVCFAVAFRELEAINDAWTLMGSFTIVSSALSAIICIRGYAGLFCGNDATQEDGRAGNDIDGEEINA